MILHHCSIFAFGIFLLQAMALAAPTHLVEQTPPAITNTPEGVALADFGRVAFGNLRLNPSATATNTITVHLGEALSAGRINRNPPGSVRYSKVEVKLDGASPVVVAPPPDPRNTEQISSQHPPAILTPAEWGVVTPFRWVEIEGWPGELRPEQITRRAGFAAAWDDDAARFECSDALLNRIWDLCRYSIKATTFAGVYVDGDRERIPYEADAYLNQLSHYATDNDIHMARDTFDHLMRHPTWPTEWAAHMIFMAHADWMHTGDTNWLAPRYEALKAKLLLERAGPDGLLVSSEDLIKKGDLVDWPKGERDGFVFKPVNTVVNAFYLRSLTLMAEMAQAIGRDVEAKEYSKREQKVRAVFQEKLYDRESGLYRDGVGTDHCSLHANLFPLAFGLVPDARRAKIAVWLARRGMKCSVYAAQYLLEGLFVNGQENAAIELMVAPGDRSWRHMIESGTTITWEAWDQKYKPNQDWNHAWGAAPANLLPRYVLGVRPLAPGWNQALIQPNPGALTSASGKVPTPRGPITIKWQRGETFTLSLALPKGMTARVELPAPEKSTGVFAGDRELAARHVNARWILDQPVAGQMTLEVR
ncbi:MAG: hypothetical protein RLY20_1140 [Verrucomicrobiota bacterium]